MTNETEKRPAASQALLSLGELKLQIGDIEGYGDKTNDEEYWGRGGGVRNAFELKQNPEKYTRKKTQTSVKGWRERNMENSQHQTRNQLC